MSSLRDCSSPERFWGLKLRLKPQIGLPIEGRRLNLIEATTCYVTERVVGVFRLVVAFSVVLDTKVASSTGCQSARPDRSRYTAWWRSCSQDP